MVLDSASQNILALITDPELENIDLNNCDREPIHIPNTIQPYGVLLAISVDTYEILQVSLNTAEELGIEPEALLGQPIATLLGEKQFESIERCVHRDFEHVNPTPIELQRGDSILHFDGIIHNAGAKIVILELEPSSADRKSSFDDFYRSVKSPISRLQQTNTLEELGEAIVKEVKAVSGFDRVMIYRFNQDGSGQVIAEVAEPDLEPFLGLQYPATDIPKQAKYLYTLNLLRLIPNVNYKPVGITPKLNPITNQPLDLSLSVLRGISPLHTEYLDNMGVAATMCISITRNGQLWGLIACHHQTPRKVSYEIRTICEFIGQIVSFEIAAKEGSQDTDYKMRLKSIQGEFVANIARDDNLLDSLTKKPQSLLDLVGASGAALSFGTDISLIGETPEIEEVEQLLFWLSAQFDDDVIYETSQLTELYPEAASFQETASGVLALSISRIERITLVWFRPEVVQTVDWGGNPHKAYQLQSDGSLRMSPRKSFAKWQETVRAKAMPWKACEIEAALELRSSIVGIVLRKADELAQVNKELTRSNVELDSFAYIASHDLKEPLRGIYNYSSFLIEDYGEILGDEGADRLNTLMRLTHRMEDLIDSLLHYSRLGRAELRVQSVNLNQLLAGVWETIEASARDSRVELKIPRNLPTINCDRTQVNELLTNLISNGIKYNDREQKIIEIGYLDPHDPESISKMSEYPENTPTKTIFYVRDNGIGIRARHLDSVFRIFKRLHGRKKYGGGTGAGLTIAKKIVERHGGEIWIESVYQSGSTFYFTLQ